MRGLIHLVLVWGVEIILGFVWMVELDAFFTCGPKMTWF